MPYKDERGRPWSVPLAISDALYALYDPKRSVYEIYSKMWIDRPDGGMYWKHAMARTQSSDFIHWSKPEIVLTPDDFDPSWLEFHASPVFFYNDCYFALLQILHRQVHGGIIDIELATSRDGVHWERPFRNEYFLKRSEGGWIRQRKYIPRPHANLFRERVSFLFRRLFRRGDRWERL